MPSIPTWAATAWTDIASFVAYVTMLTGYYYYLDRCTRRDPGCTVQGVNSIARRAWVEEVIAGRKDILAVQTLRNSTMAATFLASTAVLLMIGVLTLSGQQERLNDAWHALNAFGARHTELWIVKLIVLLLDFFVAFFCFSLAIRAFNHVGYMINVAHRDVHPSLAPAQVALQLNQAGRYYTFGMRAYYASIPVVLWLFGPVFMLVATVVLIAVLARLDRAPRGADPAAN